MLSFRRFSVHGDGDVFEDGRKYESITKRDDYERDEESDDKVYDKEKKSFYFGAWKIADTDFCNYGSVFDGVVKFREKDKPRSEQGSAN